MLFLCILATASFAQERIFLDAQIRVTAENSNTTYIIPSLYRLSSTSPNNHVSITRLQQALHAVVRKHSILRTALYLDSNTTLIQHCLDVIDIDHTNPYGFSIINFTNNDRHVNEVISEILNQSDLFDLSKGRVIHCHIFRQSQSTSSSVHNDDDVLSNGDLILFSIHHSAFDGTSRSVFLRDLSLAYENNAVIING